MKIAALITVCALATGVGLAKTGPKALEEAPKAKLNLPVKAKAGQVVKGTLTLTFTEGWHGYQNPPLDPYQNPITLSLKSKAAKLKKVAYPLGVIKEFAGAKAAVYEGEVTIPFEIVTPKKPGKLDLAFVVNYQQCNDSTCMPPGSLNLKASVTLAK